MCRWLKTADGALVREAHIVAIAAPVDGECVAQLVTGDHVNLSVAEVARLHRGEPVRKSLPAEYREGVQ